MSEKKFGGYIRSLTITLWLILFGLYAESLGGTAVKTFDFGTGGDNPAFRSHSRAFSPPRNVALAIVVNYRTAGEAQIPIVVEVEDAANKILATRETTAERVPKRLVINLAANENSVHGCEKPWQVRVSTRDGQVPPARVYGDITFSFVDPPAAVLSAEGGTFDLARGGQTNKHIGGADSLKHPGILSIRASWTHNPLAQALALKFEIIRPDGSVARSFTGYGTNSGGNPKLDFSYVLTVTDAKQNGAWRLRISNNSEHEIQEINPQITFRPICGS